MRPAELESRHLFEATVPTSTKLRIFFASRPVRRATRFAAGACLLLIAVWGAVEGWKQIQPPKPVYPHDPGLEYPHIPVCIHR